MGISCVIVGFLSAVLSFGNIAAIAVAVAFLIAGFLADKNQRKLQKEVPL